MGRYEQTLLSFLSFAEQILNEMRLFYLNEEKFKKKSFTKMLVFAQFHFFLRAAVFRNTVALVTMLAIKVQNLYTIYLYTKIFTAK